MARQLPRLFGRENVIWRLKLLYERNRGICPAFTLENESHLSVGCPEASARGVDGEKVIYTRLVTPSFSRSPGAVMSGR